jgi:hypothetical protein
MTKRELIRFIEKEYWKMIDTYPNMRQATVFEVVMEKAKAIVEKELINDD